MKARHIVRLIMGLGTIACLAAAVYKYNIDNPGWMFWVYADITLSIAILISQMDEALRD